MKTFTIGADYQPNIDYRPVTIHEQLEQGKIMIVQEDEIIQMSKMQFVDTLLVQLPLEYLKEALAKRGVY